MQTFLEKLKSIDENSNWKIIKNKVKIIKKEFKKNRKKEFI